MDPKLKSVEHLAATLIKRHLTDQGIRDFTFVWTRSIRHPARCWPYLHKIGLSKQVALCNPPSTVLVMILHEIAHAQTGFEHDALWQQALRKLYLEHGWTKSTITGWMLSPQVLIQPPPAKYMLTCPVCGWMVMRWRRPSTKRGCPVCWKAKAEAEAERSWVELEMTELVKIDLPENIKEELSSASPVTDRFRSS